MARTSARLGSGSRHLCPLFALCLASLFGLSLGEAESSLSDEGGTCATRSPNWKAELGAKRCRKRCASNADCGRRNKRCLCDGDCGWSCVNPASRCHALRELPNGYVRSPHDFLFHSIAHYGCDAGFSLAGPDQRVCQGDRSWSAQRPVCRPDALCGPAPEIPYAASDAPKSQDVFEVETLLHYACVSGYFRYNVKGLPKAKCLVYNGTARWFGPDLKCSARSCGNPGEVINGVREGDVFQYPHDVRYRCVAGFELIGSAVRRCGAGGSWSGTEAVCRPVECGKPSEPLHGRVLGTSLAFQSRISYSCDEGWRLVGQRQRVCGESRISYSCDEGWRLVGQRQRVCGEDGRWSGAEPLCEEIRCPGLPPLSNGYMEGDETGFNAIVLFRCLEGMSQLGPNWARCQHDATWSNPPPKCMAPCRLPSLPNGRLLGPGNRSSVLLHGERLELQCQDHHELQLPDYPLCQNGSWSHSPRCLPVRCKEWPAAVRHAQVVFAKSTHGAAAKYECEIGFRLLGSPTVTCLFGRWNGALPVCEKIICPHPSSVGLGPVAGGRVMLTGRLGTYEYAPYIRSVSEGRAILFLCDKGRALKVFCDHPKLVLGELEHGKTKLESFLGAFQYWDYIQFVGQQRNIVFQCNKGYVLQGPPRATCVNGTWSPNVRPMCIRQTHPPMEGRIVWDQGASETSRRRRRRRLKRQKPLLQPSLELKSLEYRVAAQPDGSPCPALFDNRRQTLAAVAKGRGGEFGHGAQLMALCRKGYALPSATHGLLICNDGRWEPPLQQCLPEACALPSLQHAFAIRQGQILQPPAKVPSGQGVQVVCLRGYAMDGPDVLECNLGRFLAQPGECKPLSCKLPFLRFGYYQQPGGALPANLSHGQSLKFRCARSLLPKPPSGTVACSFGDVRPRAPSCEPEEAEDPPPWIEEDVDPSSIGCPRPLDVDSAWVYRHGRPPEADQGLRAALLIDPYQDVYPNRTIVHYKCSMKRGLGSPQRGPAGLEAWAVRCADGEWLAQLLPCADAAAPPPGVQSQSSYIKRLQASRDKRLPCGQPSLGREFELVTNRARGRRSKTGWVHGSRLEVRCRGERAKRAQIRCKRGKWRRLERLRCFGAGGKGGGCSWRPKEHPHLVAFSARSGGPLKFDSTVDAGAELELSCEHPGLFQMSGDRRLMCGGGGVWLGRQPRCRSLLGPGGSLPDSLLPPPLFYRLKEGRVGVTPTGDLVVKPSSTLLIECLIDKAHGPPHWVSRFPLLCF